MLWPFALVMAASAAPLPLPQDDAFDASALDGIDLDLSEEEGALATLMERGVAAVLGSATRGTDTEAWQLDWAPGASHVLSVGTNGELDLWDAASGTRMAQAKLVDTETFAMVTSARFMANGEIAAFQDDGVLLILRGTTLDVLRKVEGVPVCSSATMSGDRRLAATLPGLFVEDGTRVVDVGSGEQVAFFTDEAGMASDVALSADGDVLVYLTHQGTNGSFVAAHRVGSGKRLHGDGLVALGDAGDGLKRSLLNVALDPAGRRVAVGSVGEVVTYDLKKGKAGKSLTGFWCGTKDMVFGSKGRFLHVGTDDGEIIRYDVLKGQETARTAAHLHGAYALALSPDGKQLASTGSDRALRFWDAATLAPLLAGDGPGGSPLCGHFEGDGGALLAGYSDGSLWRHPTGGGAAVRVTAETDGAQVVAIAPGPAGAVRILTAAGRCLLLDTGAAACRVDKLVPKGAPVTAAASDGPGVHSAFGRADGSLLVLGPDGPVLEALLGEAATSVTSVSFEPEGTRFVALTADGRGRTWDLSNGELVEDAGERDPDDEGPMTIDLHWAAPGVLAFAVDDERVALAEAQGEVLGIFGEEFAYGDGLWEGQATFAVAPNENLIAMQGAGNGFELFNATTGQRAARVDLNLRPATFATFHPGGAHVAFGLPDGRVLTWDLSKLAALR